MKVLTEAQLRAEYKQKKMECLMVEPDTILTPSAKEFLNANKIDLVFKSEEEFKEKNKENKDKEKKLFKPKYRCKDTGAYLEKKPENMTQLYGNELVFKDHQNIIFRGKIDSLQSRILELQVTANKNKSNKLIDDLEEILNFIRNILKAEVINEKIEEFSFFGLKEEEIRAISHNPKEYLGVNHVLPNYKMGELLIGLNAVRSNVREVEIVSIPLKRDDIIKALNRLSSAVYVMMCRYIAGYYN